LPWHESGADAFLPGFQAAGSAGQLGMFAGHAPTVLPDLLTSSTSCSRTCSCGSRSNSRRGLPPSASSCRSWCTPSGSFPGRRCCLPPSPGSRSPPPVRPLACRPTQISGHCTAAG
jgi:hypothetical protein